IITGALLLGLAVGMLLARARSTTQVSELTARAAAAERELAAVRQMHTEQVEAERAAAADRLTAREEELLERLASRERELLEQLETERSQSKARVEEMRADTKRLADEFESLSRKALEANSRTFLDQANERFKRAEESGASELAKREQAIKQLVEPLQRTLGEVKEEMTSAEKARLTAHSALQEQVQAMRDTSDSLRTETGQLVSALRAPQVRGR